MAALQSVRTLLSVSILAATSCSAIAAEAKSEPTGGLDEIIVTAERVESSLQDTPIALSVFNSKALKALGVIESGDIASYTPNLRMDKQPASFNGYSLGIRGVSSSEPALAVDPTVGIYVDGVYLGRSSAAAFEVVDLERIEVLRGPQGTLYGRNTTGGAVNVITTKPSGEFGLKQELTYGERDLFRSATSVDTPAYGNVSAKLSFNYGQRDGLAESSYTGGDLGQYDQQSWRIAVRWTPTDTLTADYAYDHYQQDANTNLSQLTYVRPDNVWLGGPFYEQMDAMASADRKGHLPYRTDSKDQSMDIDGHALTLSLALGEATLRSISSWREYDNRYGGQDFGEFVTDGASMLTPDFDGSLYPAGTYVHDFNSAGYNEHEQWSQELQFIGRLFDDRFGYNMGLYYFHEEGTNFDPQEYAIPALFAFGELPGGYQDFLCAGTCFGKSVLLSAPDFKYSTDNDAWAAYGQFDYALTERLTAILGLRWSVDEKTAWLTQDFSDIGLATLKDDNSWDQFNPAFTLTYNWTDELMVYAKYATGYRAGGFNVRASTVSSFEDPVNEEEVTSWELGGKSEWFERRVRLNGALFYYEYDDRQVNQFEAGSGGASSKIVNAGSSEAQGIELDLTIAPTDSILLMATYGYVDVDVKEFITSVNDPETGFPVFDANYEPLVADIADFASTVTGGPQHSGSLIMQYTFPAATTFGTLVAQVDASYAGKRTFDAQMNLYNSTESYTLWNARLTLSEIPVSRGDLSLSLWGRNLGDEEVREWGIDFGPLGYTVDTYKELRSVGVDLRYEL
ncbi:MAG: TonB-dependent receptor [Pseudomonadales bacterium]